MVAALRQAITSSEAAATAVAAPPVFGEATAVVDQAPATDVVPVAARRRPFPWVPLAAGCGVLLIAFVVAALLVLPRLVSQLAEQASPPTEAEATSLPAEAAESPTETPGVEGATEAAVTPTAGKPGWTVFLSGDEVRALAAQDQYIWAGGSGGLVRWDRSDGSYEWFTAADGLASNIVNTLLVDPQGKLWAGTEGGLSRYDPDADRWTTFDTTDGLDSDSVVSLFYDTDGKLWAGTVGQHRGFNVYDGTEWRAPGVPPIPSLEFPKPRVMLRDGNGAFWVGLDEKGVARFDGKEWQTFAVDPDNPDAGVSDLVLTSQGELLAAASAVRVVCRFKPDAGTWEPIPQLDGFPTNAILEDADGILWFAGDGGVYRFDPQTNDWESYEAESQELPGRDITSVAEDADGALWFGMDGSGLSRFKDGQWETWAVGKGPAGNDIGSIVEDGAGNIWGIIGGGGGVGRYNPTTDAWKTFTEKNGALDWPGVLAVDRKGQVWMGGWASVRFFDGERWHPIESDALGEYNVWAITQDESGAMWFGTEVNIIRYNPDDGSTQIFTTSDGLPEGQTYQLASAPDGLIVANVSGKLVVFDGTHWRLQFPDHQIDQITTAPSGEVWVAGGDRFFVYDGKTWNTIDAPELWVAVLSVGPDGIVWAGSGDGLARFDPKGQAWRRLKPGDGALPTSVKALLVAHDGALWVGTPAGLGRYVSP
jgi:ligand-binding sensor domain-containing protein